MIRIAIAVIMLAFLAPAANAQINLVQNPGFETGDFSGWTTDSQGAGVLGVYDDGNFPFNANVPTPFGTFSAGLNQSGPSTNFIYQDVAIPAGGGASFSMQLWYDNTASQWADPGDLDFQNPPNQQLRVDIMDPAAPLDDVGAGVLLNIFRTQDGDPFLADWFEITADLSAFAGQTIRLRIAEADTQGNFFVAADEASISASQATVSVPIPADQPLAMLMLVLGTLLVGGIALRRTV